MLCDNSENENPAHLTMQGNIQGHFVLVYEGMTLFRARCEPDLSLFATALHGHRYIRLNVLLVRCRMMELKANQSYFTVSVTSANYFGRR